jgi:hypothetical protein
LFFALTSFQIHIVFRRSRKAPSSTNTPFLATPRISLPDIAELQSAFSITVDASLCANLPNVIRHYETILN